jgi:hypothetical protein
MEHGFAKLARSLDAFPVILRRRMEAVPDDQTQWERSPAGDRRSTDPIDGQAAPPWRRSLDVVCRFHIQSTLHRLNEPRRALAGTCRLIEVFWITRLLADDDPVASPCSAVVVTGLVLVIRGCRGSICGAAVDTLRDGGPSVVIRRFRPLRHCGREGCGGHQSESRAASNRVFISVLRICLSIGSRRATRLR